MAPRGGRGGQNRKKDKSKKDERRRKLNYMQNGHAVLNGIIASLGRAPHPNSKLELASDGKELLVSLNTLIDLPESIGTLDGLQVLKFPDCSQLSELPARAAGLHR